MVNHRNYEDIVNTTNKICMFSERERVIDFAKGLWPHRESESSGNKMSLKGFGRAY